MTWARRFKDTGAFVSDALRGSGLARRVVGVVLLLAAPLALIAFTRALADSWGTQSGRWLATWATALPKRAATLPVDLVAPPLAAESAPVPAVEPAAKAVPARGRKPRAAAPGRGVFVPASAVLALARGGILPRAVAVPASGARPAGLRLLDVSQLGVGLRDGDVLVRVAGAPAGSVSAVAEVVVRLRAGRAPRISAEFWREGVPWSLVVEQPYLEHESRRTGP